MKSLLITLVALLGLFAAANSFAQWGPPQQAPESQPLTMYDNQYRGPMNVYGQPVYSTTPQQNNGQPQQAPEGIIPMAASGLEAFGRYLWGYLPAPIRGEEPQILPPPGSGFVVRQVVPGLN